MKIQNKTKTKTIEQGERNKFAYFDNNWSNINDHV